MAIPAMYGYWLPLITTTSTTHTAIVVAMMRAFVIRPGRRRALPTQPTPGL
jgi:hypothetical protein